MVQIRPNETSLLVVCLLSRDDRRVGDQWEVNARIRNQIGLEFGQIDIQSPIESQRSRNRRYDLRDQAIQVGVGGTIDIQVATESAVLSLPERLVKAKGTYRQMS